MNLLQNYTSKWNLIAPVQIAQTATSNVYNVESNEHGSCVLKIFTELGRQDESVGSFFLKVCQPEVAVEAYQFDSGAQLLEKLEPPNLYTFSKQDREERATEVFSTLIRGISTSEFSTVKRKLRDLKVLYTAFDRVTPPEGLGKAFVKAKKLSDELTRSQTSEVLLHGDLHHENVMKRKNSSFVCFDPKGFYGDPAYELGTVLKNPKDYPAISQNVEVLKGRAKTFSETLNIDFDRIIKFTFIHHCLSVAWAVEDGGEFGYQLPIVNSLESLL